MNGSMVCLAVLGVACASAGGRAQATQDEAGVQQQQEEGLVPTGYGTLRQDAVTISLRQGPLLIKVTPLDEAVIRLLAPDTYTRLHALAASRGAEAGADDRTELFLVSYYSYQPDIAFQPENLQLSYQNQLLRPGRIVPITTGFGRQRLAQQENQSAVYAFDGPIDYKQALVVQYDVQRTDAWSRIIPVLDVERAKVQARASGKSGGP